MCVQLRRVGFIQQPDWHTCKKGCDCAGLVMQPHGHVAIADVRVHPVLVIVLLVIFVVLVVMVG